GGERGPCGRRRHAGVTEPSARGPRAPVAAGRLLGFPASVRKPRNAKATASLASPSKKSWSNGTTGRGRTRAASSSTRAGLRAPPPEMTSSCAALGGGGGGGGGAARAGPRGGARAVGDAGVGGGAEAARRQRRRSARG